MYYILIHNYNYAISSAHHRTHDFPPTLIPSGGLSNLMPRGCSVLSTAIEWECRGRSLNSGICLLLGERPIFLGLCSQLN